MTDFTNQQLAEIITQNAEKINNSILRERKIANELAETVLLLKKEKNDIQEKIKELKTVSIQPDLSAINSFYMEKTREC
ncbi:hypothetical protein ACP3T3_00620 [Chryseobacterium sp. CBSDS_008]|uniref:hypothetical protein n=1 Tax=Chryseobacterium sp. CBSDS_008 TaxID=3415265 RepID=UPI003CEFAFB1